MNIIRKSEGISAGDLYSMTKSNYIKKMTEAKGKNLAVKFFVEYSDVDVNGNEMTILSFLCEDGICYATNSPTFVRNFNDLVSIYEETGETIPSAFKVGTGTSRAGREYITCDLA